MLDSLRTTCRQLLEEGTVQVLIGYGRSRSGKAQPVFLTEPQHAEQLVWDEHCHHNLAVYLKRPELRARGRMGLVVKACDERAVAVLQQDSQLDRQQVYLVGVACDGFDPAGTQCRTCVQRRPQQADVVLSSPAARPGLPSAEPGNDAASSSPHAARLSEPGSPVAEAANGAPAADRYTELDRLLALPVEQRLELWQRELARCTRCYACRQACPLCYCTRCIAEKNRPVCISPSPTARGNFAWHVTRAFHLAGRCVGCGQCTRACPAGIDLSLLNMSLARAAEVSFGHRAGERPDGEPMIGSYREQDSESFIR